MIGFISLRDRCTPTARRALSRASIRLNRLVCAIVRSRFHKVLSARVILITVTGCRTGRRYSIPVGYHQFADILTIFVSDAENRRWWRNYRDERPIDVLLRGERRSGRAVVLPAHSKEFKQRAEDVFRRTGFMARIFGVRFDAKTGLTADQVDRLGRDAKIVRIRLGR